MRDWLGSHRIEIGVAAVLLVIVSVPVLLLLWMTAVPGRSHAGPLPAVTPAQARLADALRRHVETIARTPHNSAHPEALEAAARAIEEALKTAGYQVQTQPFTADGHSVRNIEAVLEPADGRAPTLVVGAHYDSYADTPGANDNGSGTAALLALARALSDRAGQSALRIRFVFFVNEEPPYFQTPLMGSLVSARRIAGLGETVIGMISLETMGFYSEARGSQHYPFPLSALYPDRGDFIAFVGMTGSRPFVRRTVGDFRAVAHIPSVGGTAPGFVQGIGWSDHWSFAQVGIPALMVTDSAPFRYRHYHSAGDTPDRIDYRRLALVVTGLEQMLRRWTLPGAAP